MKMPKLEPPQSDITREALQLWIDSTTALIAGEQPKELAAFLYVLVAVNPQCFAGFVTCYGIVREALIRQETEELEAMFKEGVRDA